MGRLKVCRDLLLPGLQALPGVRVSVPPGGRYAFFRIEVASLSHLIPLPHNFPIGTDSFSEEVVRVRVLRFYI